MTTLVSVHATAVVVGEAGVLIEGPSGSGKSALALAMIASRPRLVRLVGDDRVRLSVAGGRLVARPHPRLAGLIEQRGSGLLPIEHDPACVIRLVVRRESVAERLPEVLPRTNRVGLELPLRWVPPEADAAAASIQVFAAIEFLDASGCFERV